jgi:hypothetical protein
LVTVLITPEKVALQLDNDQEPNMQFNSSKLKGKKQTKLALDKFNMINAINSTRNCVDD